VTEHDRYRWTLVATPLLSEVRNRFYGGFNYPNQPVKTRLAMVEPVFCPKCAAQVHPEWPFCSHCGSRLMAFHEANGRFPACSNCGAAVDTTGAFCWKCGVPLDTGRQPFIPDPGHTAQTSVPRDDSIGVYLDPSERSTSRPSIGSNRVEDQSPATPWWLRGLITRRSDPRWSYLLGLFVGVGLVGFLSIVSPLGAELASFQMSNVFLATPLLALAFLVLLLGLACISTILAVVIEREFARRRDSTPPITAI
jgi:hypothetical protein